ncbi:hypothetical protein D3C81_1671940 [compost metagenome]
MPVLTSLPWFWAMKPTTPALVEPTVAPLLNTEPAPSTTPAIEPVPTGLMVEPVSRVATAPLSTCTPTAPAPLSVSALPVVPCTVEPAPEDSITVAP